MSISQKQQPTPDYAPVLAAQAAAAKAGYSKASVKKMEAVWETYKGKGQ